MVVAMIQMVNPAWAWGVVAAAAWPLLLHLLSARGGRLAAFPAVRFVQQAAADAARLLRPRHWLLMLLRTAALGAIVLTLAQPVWFGRAVASPGGPRLAVIIILDRTASMRRTAGGATLFDDARRRAIALLENLDPAHDVANVVLLDDAPRALLPAAGANFAYLAEHLETVEPVLTHGDVSVAVAVATNELRRLSDQPPRRLRIEVLSDMQASQWDDVRLDRSIPLRTHRIGREQDNLAVFEPVCSIARPVAGQPARVSLRVGNFTGQRRDVSVVLAHDGGLVRQAVRLDAYTSGTAVFNFTPTTPGKSRLTFDIEHEGDALSLDDRTGLVIPVAAARPVALVTAASIDDPSTAAFFVSRALRAAGAGIELVVRRPGEPIGRAVDVVLMVEAGEVTPAAYAEQAAVIHAAEANEGGSFQVGEVRTDSPILAVFEGPAMQSLLHARFNRRTVDQAPASRTLIAFDDNAPLLTFDGSVATILADLSPRSTDFVKGPAFAPLLHQLIRGLAPPTTAPSPLRHPTSHDSALGLQPDGRWIELAPSESDLRVLQTDGHAQATLNSPTTAASVPPLRSRAVELWPALLALALLCLLIEPAAAQWRGGGHDA